MAKRDVSGALFRAIGERDALRDALREARNRVAKASPRGGAKTKAKAARDAIQQRYERTARRVDQLAAKVPEPRKRKKSLPKKKASPKRRAPQKPPQPPKSPPPPPKGPGAKEWEVGINYEGARRQGNSVMVNFRILKRGGGDVSQGEANAAVKMLHRGASASEVRAQLGLTVEGVNWQRPGWSRTKAGSAADLASFSGILQTAYLDDFRVSPVEPDE